MATQTKSQRKSKLKVNASKERARECRLHLKQLRLKVAEADPSKADVRRLNELEAFLEAAEKKLPTEAAYDRDAQRRKGG